MIPYFPVMMHFTEIGNFKDIEKDLIKCAYDYRKKDPKGRVISNEGGWQSSLIQNDDNIIKSTLMKVISSYFQSNKIFEYGGDLDTLWININGKGDYNVNHNHPLADLSGTVWIKTPKNSGKLQFISPHDFVQAKEMSFYSKKYRDENKIFPNYYFPPTAGFVIIFPSFLLHQVRPNKSNQDRISVSFNLRLNK